MGDIIDLKARRKGQEVIDNSVQNAPVMDITNIREQQIESDRREAKRTILNGFIGASVVIPGRGLLKVSLFDISKGGLSFDIGSDSGHFREHEEVAIRFYFSQTTYFPFVVRVTSFRINADDGVARHGANFVSDLSNMHVINHFVDFLESVATNLRVDKGDLFINGFGI
jgi:hypothetical protein